MKTRKFDFKAFELGDAKHGYKDSDSWSRDDPNWLIDTEGAKIARQTIRERLAQCERVISGGNEEFVALAKDLKTALLDVAGMYMREAHEPETYARMERRYEKFLLTTGVARIP